MQENEPDSTLTEQVERAKRDAIKRWLLETNCNIRLTAQRLGVNTTHIYRCLRRFGWIERGPIDRVALYRRLTAGDEGAQQQASGK
jgi:DNA-binding NtrC family response regulator